MQDVVRVPTFTKLWTYCIPYTYIIINEIDYYYYRREYNCNLKLLYYYYYIEKHCDFKFSTSEVL